MLEELAPEVKYDAWQINIMEGDQFTSGFVSVNPNSKIPALTDRDTPDGLPLHVFESGSILLYLAEKYRSPLLPSDYRGRFECITWLFFQVGAGPFIGQFGHFFKYAPEKIEYGINRYTMEVKRLLDVLDKRLIGREYIMGENYSIADIAWFPWVICIDKGYNGSEQVGLNNYSNVVAWIERCKNRPASRRGLVINSKICPNYTSGQEINFG